MTSQNDTTSRKKIGIYSPYFGVLGGGELYLGTIAEVLSQNHEVELISESPIPLSRLQEFLGLNLQRCNIRIIPPIPYVESIAPFFLHRLFRYFESTSFTKEFDLFILMPRNFRIPYRVLSSKKILHLQVPDRPWRLGDFGRALLKGKLAEFRNRMVKAIRYPARFSEFDAVLVNSQFHFDVISGKLRDSRMMVLAPPVSLKKGRSWPSKEKIILNVGRFFRGLHSKRQDVLIKAFRVVAMNAPDWKFVLAGGRADDEGSLRYFEELQREAAGLPVELHANIPKNQLDDLYERASFYWHAAGFGAPPNAPEQMEHFGITTVEAMSAGCIPFVYRAGGQLEIIDEGIDGVFWEMEGELIDKTLKAIELGPTMENISEASVRKSQKFSKENFVKKILQLVGSL